MKKLLAVSLVFAGVAWAQFVPRLGSTPETPPQVTTSTVLADAGYVDNMHARVTAAINELADSGYFDQLFVRSATAIGVQSDGGTFSALTTGSLVSGTNTGGGATFGTGLITSNTTDVYFDDINFTQFLACSRGTGICNAPNGFAAASITENSRNVPVAVPNDGGSPTVAMEYGRDVMSSGTKTVVFKNAFTKAPACFCQDGSAISACDVPIATISTTQAVVNGTTTDLFSWLCIGDR